jgi:3-methylfumaryl-CoA hydratase
MVETNLDIDHLRSWIGRTEVASDLLTDRLAAELCATLATGPGASRPGGGEAVSLSAHWCLTPLIVPGTALGPDGHPTRGGFLPPVPLPRRMWAGGELRFHDRLRVGDIVNRHSRIADVSVKTGRSGTLCFVTVEHEITTLRGPTITERHDIVYRGIEIDAKPATSTDRKVPQFCFEMNTDPVMLFRYSALTFNGHRIHYDRRYVTEVEHYPGLIVHGPLQATLLIELAEQIEGRPPVRFSFRGVAPLFDSIPFSLCATRRHDGLDLWIETAEGVKTMQAEALL